MSSQCDRCKKEIIEMTTSNQRRFDGGTLIVTDIPVQKCGCEEEIHLADGALMAGYARLLASHKIVGNVTVSLMDLEKNFSMQDFFPKSATL
ncbi:hypothetical protein C0Q44_28410 [Paenibacillus sp. PCH8]|nr:hypothetical protein C0Q44_28410 [Paenibacillus sp. PCH8]